MCVRRERNCGLWWSICGAFSGRTTENRFDSRRNSRGGRRISRGARRGGSKEILVSIGGWRISRGAYTGSDWRGGHSSGLSRSDNSGDSVSTRATARTASTTTDGDVEDEATCQRCLVPAMPCASVYAMPCASDALCQRCGMLRCGRQYHLPAMPCASDALCQRLRDALCQRCLVPAMRCDVWFVHLYIYLILIAGDART